jgi:hypothetical protein
MHWFERITGFPEMAYAETKRRLEVSDGKLRSTMKERSYGVGDLELVSLNSLRERVKAASGPSGRLKVSIVQGDVREMHSAPEHLGALFQVASQFNLLEMPSPEITPDDGVADYEFDNTQGPACAMAAGAATIYRNYFAVVDGHHGQTSERQLDGLADIGRTLSDVLALPVGSLWSMRNGYAMCTRGGLDAISAHLTSLSQELKDELRGQLRIGVQSDVEVTDAPENDRIRVSQAFCSALPVGYGRDIPAAHWAAFAQLVLEACYEATIWTAVLNARRTGSKIVLLTLVGGGVFRNEFAWIEAAIRRALRLAAHFDLDVRLVSYGGPHPVLLRLAADFK